MQARRFMRARPRWLALLLGLILIGGAALLYALPEIVRWVAVARIHAATDRPVSIEAVELNLLTGRVDGAWLPSRGTRPAGAVRRLRPAGGSPSPPLAPARPPVDPRAARDRLDGAGRAATDRRLQLLRPHPGLRHDHRASRRDRGSLRPDGRNRHPRGPGPGRAANVDLGADHDRGSQRVHAPGRWQRDRPLADGGSGGRARDHAPAALPNSSAGHDHDRRRRPHAAPGLRSPRRAHRHRPGSGEHDPHA